ncbi:hypothetical protein [Microbacterium sp. zg-YB36]|uniref:hypothetical protein n=1 Tax=Microbacterium sp. zg-YB36 TaxID=2969407 RepID=UPI00214C402A|nr:hypothetical protein [Microbacterium sp. zg-YB36]MDL5351191.1 hypothetical protein [Microbacterium sp. zg-YB36]
MKTALPGIAAFLIVAAAFTIYYSPSAMLRRARLAGAHIPIQAFEAARTGRKTQ